MVVCSLVVQVVPVHWMRKNMLGTEDKPVDSNLKNKSHRPLYDGRWTRSLATSNFLVNTSHIILIGLWGKGLSLLNNILKNKRRKKIRFANFHFILNISK